MDYLPLSSLCAFIWICERECVCGVQRLILSVFLSCSSVLFLKKGPSLSLEHTDWQDYLTNEFQQSFCSATQCWQVYTNALGFLCGYWGSSSHPHHMLVWQVFNWWSHSAPPVSDISSWTATDKLIDAQDQYNWKNFKVNSNKNWTGNHHKSILQKDEKSEMSRGSAITYLLKRKISEDLTLYIKVYFIDLLPIWLFDKICGAEGVPKGCSHVTFWEPDGSSRLQFSHMEAEEELPMILKPAETT